MARNFMYRAHLATDAARDWRQKQDDLAAAQAARADEGGWTSLASLIGGVIGGYFGGPAGAAVGAGLFSWGTDELIDSESKRVEAGKFYGTEASQMNRDLSAQDRAADWGHLWTGLETGAKAYTFGKATELGGFGEGLDTTLGEKLTTGFDYGNLNLDFGLGKIFSRDVESEIEEEGKGVMDYLGQGWDMFTSSFDDTGVNDEFDETYGEIYTPYR